MRSVKMDQTHCISRNWDRVEGKFRFDQDHQKRLLEKPQEVDEACYSLEESSPDLDETLPAYYVSGKRITGEYRRSDSGRERSLPSEECYSETTFAPVGEKEWKALYYRENNGNPPRTFGSGRTSQPKDSDPSGTLIPRGVAEFFPSAEQILPDFDHLLSNESETGEESSEDVKRMCQQMVQAGHSSCQIYDELNRSRFRGKLYGMQLRSEIYSDFLLIIIEIYSEK